MADFLDTNGLRLLWTKIKALVVGKADKVANAVSGNFAGLDSTGNLTDSGYSPSDFQVPSDVPRVIIPSVDGTMQNMTSDEIAALRMGDVIMNRSNSLSEQVPMYMGYIVERIFDTHIYCSHPGTDYIYTVLFTKYQNSWGYSTLYSVVLSSFARKISVATTQPQSGMRSNTIYNLGELTADTTFTLASATDNTIANVWEWTFSFGAITYNITWPSGITWAGDLQPTLVANRNYQIRVMNGIASCVWSSIPTP